MDLDGQRRVAALLLAVVGPDGFALAGSSAIREHGLTARPTHDVDLFGGPTMPPDEFQHCVDRAQTALCEKGYRVDRSRSFPSFVRLQVHDATGAELEVDFGINWRARAPATMSIGPVLSEADAVAGKLSAVYSRGEVRDYLDLDTIRGSGRYSDEELLELGREQDPGFEAVMFAQQLSRVADIPPSYAEQYGVSAADFTGVQERLYSWAVTLRDASSP